MSKPENKAYRVIRPKGRWRFSGWWSGSFGGTDNNSVADSIAKVSIQDLTLSCYSEVRNVAANMILVASAVDFPQAIL